jgi:hypothetical protein
MRCNHAAGFIATILVIGLVGLNLVPSEKLFQSGSAIAAKDKPICDRNNLCLPPPV